MPSDRTKRVSEYLTTQSCIPVHTVVHHIEPSHYCVPEAAAASCPLLCLHSLENHQLFPAPGVVSPVLECALWPPEVNAVHSLGCYKKKKRKIVSILKEIANKHLKKN